MKFKILNPRFFAASLLLLLFIIGSQAQSPAQSPSAVNGRTLELMISSGTFPFASSGSFRFIPAATDSRYAIVPISGNTAAGSGTHTYTKLSANTARFSLVDNNLGALTVNCTFTTPTSGTYSVTSTAAPGRSQSGTFVMYSGTSPGSLIGTVITVNITSGAFPFANFGTFSFRPNASGNAYLAEALSGNVADSNGTYTYTKNSTWTGLIAFADSRIGPSSSYLSFDTATTGTALLWQEGGTGYQTGLFVMTTLPTITEHPMGQTVNDGSKTAFTVSATGSAPLSYQWRKNGENISGATLLTYSILNVQPLHAGSYTVSVSNPEGSVTSNPAELIVHQITTEPSTSGPSQAQEPAFLTNGLIAYFPFNGNAKDESGNGYDGKVFGAVLTTNRFGKADSAYLFNKLDAYIRVDGIGSKDFQGDFSVSAWLYLDEIVTDYPAIFIGENLFIQLLIHGNIYKPPLFTDLYGTLSFATHRVADPAHAPIWSFVSPDKVPLSRYHHVFVSRKGTKGEVWLDGSSVGSYDAPLESARPGNFIEIGGFSDPNWRGGMSLNGVVDDLRIYRRSFTEAEIHALYDFEGGQKARRAKATGVLVNGFLVEVKVTDGGAGYTDAPRVTIKGGGGTGATAFSIISNGFVDRVFILNSGSGFTSIPTISLEPPYSPPSLSISVATVSVTMRLIEGKRYQLESSRDSQAWQVTGPSFTADKSEVTKFFEVAETGRYFRMSEVQ